MLDYGVVEGLDGDELSEKRDSFEHFEVKGVFIRKKKYDNNMF